MRNILIILMILRSLLVFSQSADDVLKEADKAFKVKDLYSVTEIIITRNGKKLPIQIVEGFSTVIDDKNYSLSVYKSPKKMQGNANLMIGDNLWVKFASTGRVRKLSSSAKKNSSGGSDFSYIDMGSGSEGVAANYTSKLLGEKKVNGFKCYEIELIPTDNNESGYDKLIVYVSKEKHEYLEILYFEDGANIKNLYLSDYRQLGEYTYPYQMVMKSNVNDSQTEIITRELELNSEKVTENLFSQSHLKKIK